MPTGYFHLFAVVLGNGTPQAVRGLYRLDQCGYTSSSCSFLWCISKHGIINQAFLRLLLRVRLPCGTGTAAGRRYHPDGGKGFWTGRPRCPLPVTGSKHLHTEGPRPMAGGLCVILYSVRAAREGRCRRWAAVRCTVHPDCRRGGGRPAPVLPPPWRPHGSLSAETTPPAWRR